jgi:hypothetical protein
MNGNNAFGWLKFGILGTVLFILVYGGFRVFKWLGMKGGLNLVNPASTKNIAYQSTNAIVSAVTGRDETLGGWIYDKLHPDPLNTPQQIVSHPFTGTPVPAAGTVYSVDPKDPNFIGPPIPDVNNPYDNPIIWGAMGGA